MYIADEKRYDTMRYNRCGRSGIKLPAVSIGLWHNFGGVDNLENSRTMVRLAFDHGITHFDLANNYGPPFGSAETTFGEIMRQDMMPYRDEMIISTKAGWGMWPGPYGNFGSRKYLIASLDQSLKRMGLDYVDIFYHHRPDPETPMEESLGALDHIVKSGKALYAGISSYSTEQTQKAVKILNEMGTPLLIHQPKYNMFSRGIEESLLKYLEKAGVGSIVFSPLAQGLLTDRYLNDVPADSRAGRPGMALSKSDVTPEKIAKVRELNQIAMARGQSLAQMAISWVLRQPAVTSALFGASKPSQVLDVIASLDNAAFSDDELDRIDAIVGEG